VKPLRDSFLKEEISVVRIAGNEIVREREGDGWGPWIKIRTEIDGTFPLFLLELPDLSTVDHSVGDIVVHAQISLQKWVHRGIKVCRRYLGRERKNIYTIAVYLGII
jgi:hypothetical protein